MFKNKRTEGFPYIQIPESTICEICNRPLGDHYPGLPGEFYCVKREQKSTFLQISTDGAILPPFAELPLDAICKQCGLPKIDHSLNAGCPDIRGRAMTTEAILEQENDPVNHPKRYTSSPSGIECIQVTEHMGFNIGNAVKYLWRADEKGAPTQDLEKAIWYIKRELEKRSK